VIVKKNTALRFSRRKQHCDCQEEGRKKQHCACAVIMEHMVNESSNCCNSSKITAPPLQEEATATYPAALLVELVSPSPP
jgi:hypothetical protein